MSGGHAFTLTIALLASLLVSPARAQFPASGPPLPIERETTETPRNVAAADYRDAYCAKWTDSCTSCERATANDEPKCRAIADAACERKPVQCQALLKTANRVCLAYGDGCNRCLLGICTLTFCPAKAPDGSMRPKDPDYRCYFLRRAHYEDSGRLSTDLSGHWRLTDPRGRACEIINGPHLVSLTPGCIALGEWVTAIREARMSGFTFQLAAHGGVLLLTFDTRNLDELNGTGASQGWRLTRMEATAFEPRGWEGAWLLRRDGFECRLFLTMRTHTIGPRIRADVVHVPYEISLASNCLEPIYNVQIGIPSVDRTRPQPLLPRWTGWRTEGHDLLLSDEAGTTTRFTPGHDGAWRAEISPAGIPPIAVSLQRQQVAPR